MGGAALVGLPSHAPVDQGRERPVATAPTQAFDGAGSAADAERRWPPDRPTVVLVLATLAGAGIVFWLIHDALVDDAYITLSYGRTLGLHGEWGLVPGYESNTATSSLNVLLLGLLIAVVREPMVALCVLYLATCVVSALGLRALGRELGLGLRVAVAGVPLLVANPLLASSLGLETTMVVAASTFLAWAAARGHALWFGIVAGILMWLRLDTLAIVAVMFLLSPPLWRRWYQAVPVAAAVLLPWLLFSWISLGSAIPDTLVIKQDDTDMSFVGGFVERYHLPYPYAVVAVLAVCTLGALVAVSWPLWRGRLDRSSSIVPVLALAAVAYYAEFALLGVAPFFWYYGLPSGLLTICAAIGLAGLSTSRLPAARVAGLVAAAGAAVVLGLSWFDDVREAAPLEAMPIHGNWAYPGEYRRIGTELGEIVGDEPIQSPGEVGALAYYCECKLSDRFSERAQLVDDIRRRKEESWLMRLNYYFFDPADHERMGSEQRLLWRRGPDPDEERGWDGHGLVGGAHERGHFVIVPFDRPNRRQ
jgi:hypothetical protein